MTILPKKKSQKEKNEPEQVDHSKVHSHNPAAETRTGRVRTSPPHWSSTVQRDEKLASHDPGGSYDPLESGTSHNKRRHRSPQHRRERKQHRHSSAHIATTSKHDSSYDKCSAPEPEDPLSGYNSGDEYDPPACPENVEELEARFEKRLKDKFGWIIKKMGTDGACLFRAIADQVYGDEEMHSVVRGHCVDYMAKNHDHFEPYITEDFHTYINRKRMDSCHGNHIEMQAMAEMYNRPVEVYQYSLKPINTFHGAYRTDDEPIRISYHRNVHYNSIRDPYKATVGVGLGLPGYQPGLADLNLMRDATRLSEECHIEQTMLQDKLRETDWEVTQESLMEQVARDSYLQWLKDNDKRCRESSSTCSASATSSSSVCTSTAPCSPEVRLSLSPRSGQGSPKATDAAVDLLLPISPKPCGSKQKSQPNSPKAMTVSSDSMLTEQGGVLQGAVGGADFDETASIMNQLPPTMYGLNDWDEDDVIAQVIAQSQQEYLDSLKRNRVTPRDNC